MLTINEFIALLVSIPGLRWSVGGAGYLRAFTPDDHYVCPITAAAWHGKGVKYRVFQWRNAYPGLLTVEDAETVAHAADYPNWAVKNDGVLETRAALLAALNLKEPTGEV